MAMVSFWPDSLFLPFYVATASIFVLFALLWNSSSGQAAYFKLEPTGLEDARATHSVAEHVENHGGVTIFAFKMARLAGCLVLLSLSLVSLVEEDKLPLKPVAMCITYFYASILAVLSVATGAELGRITVKHLNALLLCTFGVYLYRDVFPLATFALNPLDLAEGLLLWAKIVILFTVACVIPLVIPRQYIPVDPETPMPVPNPEQTTSLLSLVLYSFLDPLIFLANRTPHLDFNQLPPLADYDHAENLKAKAFPHMDVFAGKKRHIFFPIVWIFRWVFLEMGVMLTIMALAAFIAPLGLNRLLNSLENPSQDAFMRPWFWIILLFVGPMAGSLAFQWYIFVSMRMVTQVTAIITQLVFEHAMRIRVKSETGVAASKKAAQGNMTNLVTSDLAHINEARNIQFLLILVPVQIIGAIFFFAFVGMGAMVALFPVPGYVAKLQGAAQKATLKTTDARVQTVSETMNVLRMVKMFGWEKQMNAKITEKRDAELSKLWKRRLLDMVDGILNPLIPILTMLATYDCNRETRPKCLKSETVTSLFMIKILKAPGLLVYGGLRLTSGPTVVYFPLLVLNGKVSLDRLDAFLHETELLDSFTSTDPLNILTQDEASSNMIGFRNTSFAWTSSEESNGTLTPTSRQFLLKIEGELLFKPGCINLVLGPTGSGKTSLLCALLGEMHLVPSSLSSWYNLPRAQGVSYAAQEGWVMNDTIRNNILFNSPMDEERYNKVLYQCCLTRDLELWDAGDETEVGERGLTLSGGQKARITLSRAVYSQTQVILLDDVLAALDVHTAKWIVDKCLQGDLVKNRTVILVTHNVVLTSKIAEFVVSVGLDGRVHSQASVSEALERDELLAKEVITDQEIIDAAEKEIDSPAADEPKKKDGKLIIAEEIAIGHVSWKALTLYFKGMGGSHTVLFFVVLVLGFVVNQVIEVSQTYYLGYWASQYGQGTPVPVFKYLGGFSSLLFAGLVVYSVLYIYYTFGSFRASRTIHRQLVESVIAATLRWLDLTPTSRIIARSTVDISAVDNWIPGLLQAVLEKTIGMLTKFCAIILFTPIFFFAGALVGIIGATLSKIYLASQLSVKREQSNTKAPVLAHFGATMTGLISVRAYGAQEALIKVSLDRINRMSRASRTFSNLNRWVVIRIDVLGALFATSLAYYVVYFQSARPFNVGFSLNMAIGFAEVILNWVRLINQFEVQGNSLERIQQYLEIDQEAEPTASGVPPAYWPASGSLSVDNLSAKYSPDPSAPTVLHDISFNVRSGERVGIVGRTGSGKSSLTLSLLRCIFTEGTVYYDGLPTSSINLDVLRRNITIIPQVPELLVGSLRSNLDIFQQFDDATLNNALHSAGLSSLQEDMNEGKLTLDTEISAGGANLSVGQRQIIALARALVRGSKLLILDEATSAIDYKTDAVIQSSLRTELPGDTTLLIVAHRLQTIMDADKIMVLDAGRIVEFDTPKKLLQRKDGLLRALVDESGDRDALYSMAQGL
ncbi:multidrug resistance-associated ABC transporter [Mycena metata]|uniref:Multidrug resistance-associated ABC transporter n=2 Tax=Mycena metata TaxID=1033252 RepID=A0AAD7NB73_9AGAR|nr:multidrug resistance-associated ABC transporter [Mycena metata]